MEADVIECQRVFSIFWCYCPEDEYEEEVRAEAIDHALGFLISVIHKVYH